VDALRFEITVSIADERFMSAVRALIDTAAQSAGCPSASAAQFASRVEAAIEASLRDGGAGAAGLLPVTVRHADGPVEVLVNGNLFSLDV
jgi:hypothetical protein